MSAFPWPPLHHVCLPLPSPAPYLPRPGPPCTMYVFPCPPLRHACLHLPPRPVMAVTQWLHWAPPAPPPFPCGCISSHPPAPPAFLFSECRRLCGPSSAVGRMWRLSVCGMGVRDVVGAAICSSSGTDRGVGPYCGGAAVAAVVQSLLVWPRLGSARGGVTMCGVLCVAFDGEGSSMWWEAVRDGVTRPEWRGVAAAAALGLAGVPYTSAEALP
ncbi:hypothetical protein I4F81_000890 [Pyropia yezoensis]|uniref:Uncharacterized protein n=1 Tax=Pyropia yezoensis TaxID=2788 RepID=A0ACC3BJZ0_PYRYE|nr:hypothetical protein I4F81_000890 [Neopyropia yezoensis]